MQRFTIRNARIVLPDQVLEGGAVVIQDGRIAEVSARASTASTETPADLDADGAYLVPGLVDLHNDGLEFEIRPRPSSDLPIELALATFERRLAGSGVTTIFHAISYMDRTASQGAVSRTARGSFERSMGIAAWRSDLRAVDHHVLHRIDVWEPQHLDLVFEAASHLPIRYISLNDHTPGQGQYRELGKYISTMAAWAEQRGTGRLDVEALHQQIAERAADRETLPRVYMRVRAEAERGPLTVSTHDDDSPEKVDLGAGLGARVAEFPVTVEAARRARERGLTIVVGAPNVVRGRSSSGNLDARELFEVGLADAICADYHAPSLLPAAFRVVHDGLLDLPAAIQTVTLNPARAIGLEDRGAIEVGRRADLALVRLDDGGRPLVTATFRGGRAVHTFTTAPNADAELRTVASPAAGGVPVTTNGHS